jgi:hypothetical protein
VNQGIITARKLYHIQKTGCVLLGELGCQSKESNVAYFQLRVWIRVARQIFAGSLVSEGGFGVWRCHYEDQIWKR